jgi:hypothetical protein
MTAIRTITRLQDADDANVTPAVGEDGKALVYDHGTGKFVLDGMEYDRLLRSDTTVPVYGSDLVVNGSFATGDFTGWTPGTGWSVSGGKALHTAGSVSSLSQTVTEPVAWGEIADRRLYYLQFTISGATAGSMYVGLGTSLAEALNGVRTFSANATHTTIVNVNTTAASFLLYFDPSSDFNGSIDNISVKSCGIAVPFLTCRDQGNATPIDVYGHHGSTTYSMGVGRRALQRNLGTSNVAFGNAALSRNVLGRDNLAFGNSALAYNVTGNYNVGVGSHSLLYNGSGQWNVAIGAYSLFSSYGGYSNTAIGDQVMRSSSTGYCNTVLGASALYHATAPERVIAIGASSGFYQAGGVTPLTSVSNSIYIGDTVKGVEGEVNAVVIGYQAESIGSNKTVIGNSSTAITALFGALRIPQLAVAPTGEAGHALLYAKDNGGGKMQLCCKLGDNVEIVLGTQA